MILVDRRVHQEFTHSSGVSKVKGKSEKIDRRIQL